jgi:ADP-heptose:LPS heptosyltransferase
MEYMEQQQKKAFISNPIVKVGFGDYIIRTAVAKQIHNMGYDIIWVCPSRYTAAFLTIPWISKVFSSDDLETNLSEYRNNDIVVITGQLHFFKKQFPKIDISKYKSYSYTNPFGKAKEFHIEDPPVKRVLAQLGLDPDNHTNVFVGFRESDIDIHDKSIIINTGSYSPKRKIHPLKCVELYHKIEEHGYNPIVLVGGSGMHDCKKVFDINHIPYYEGQGTTKSLELFLSLVKKSLAIITTDTGLGHVACALEHPTIYLASTRQATNLFIPWNKLRQINVSASLHCFSDCTPNFQWSRCKGSVSSLCLTRFNTNHVIQSLIELVNNA